MEIKKMNDFKTFEKTSIFIYTMLLFGFVTFGVTTIIGMIVAYYNKNKHCNNQLLKTHYERMITICWLIITLSIFPFVLAIVGFIIPAYMEYNHLSNFIQIL